MILYFKTLQKGSRKERKEMNRKASQRITSKSTGLGKTKPTSKIDNLKLD